MKDENYIVIPGWAINQLKLEGTDLLVFSIIHGFSQDGSSKYTGSLKYLQKSTGKSRSTIVRSLNSLVEAKLLEKTDILVNGVKYAHYKSANYDPSSFIMIPPIVQNDRRGGAKTRPYSLKENLIDILKNRNKKSEMLISSKKLILEFQETLALPEDTLISRMVEFKKECDAILLEPKRDHLYRWIKKQKNLAPTKVIKQLKQEVDWSKV